MANLLFLSDYYYKNASANGICVEQIANINAKCGGQSYVICSGNCNEICKVCENEIKISFIKRSLYRKIYDYASMSKFSFVKQISNLITHVLKFVYIWKYPMIEPRAIYKYVNIGEKIIKSVRIDTIVAQYKPIEVVLAANKLKSLHPEIRYVFYSLDSLTSEGGNGLLPISFRNKACLKLEKIALKTADCSIFMNCSKAHYQNDVYLSYNSKMYFADNPLLSYQIYQKSKEIDMKSIVFAGTLNKGIRNPERALQILLPLMKNKKLHLFTHGDCNDIISKYQMKYPGIIENHGFVKHEEVMHAIYSAGFLLSIGNINSSMNPSKIYEYISTGKTIIHVYSDKNDPCLEILKKYNNIILINSNDARIDEQEISRQLNTNYNREQYLEIGEKYFMADPQYTYNIIQNISNKNM